MIRGRRFVATVLLVLPLPALTPACRAENHLDSQQAHRLQVSQLPEGKTFGMVAALSVE